MLAWISQLEPLVRTYGLLGLFLDIFLESLGLPLPGETLILVAAELSALGDMNIIAVAITAVVRAAGRAAFSFARRRLKPAQEPS